MTSMRRTIPRSARRPPPLPIRHEASPAPTSTQSTPYAPLFSTSPTSNAQSILPTLRTGSELLSPHPPTSPCTSFTYQPLSTLRWLPTSSSSSVALAAIGSARDTSFSNSVYLYSVRVQSGEVRAEMKRDLKHENGRVARMTTASSRLMVGSSDGSVRVLETELDSWERKPLTKVGELGGGEAVAGLVTLGGGKQGGVFGEHGNFCVLDMESGKETRRGKMGDAAGFSCADTVDPLGYVSVACGRSGRVGVWDVREKKGKMMERVLKDGTIGSCVAVDWSQGWYVMGGGLGGDVWVWDMRGKGEWLSKVLLHDGVVWDIRVVGGVRGGLLLSCGEDGRVWLMDFASASWRDGGVGENAGEAWRGRLEQANIRDISKGPDEDNFTGGVNAVDAHGQADLVGLVGDNGRVRFGSLYS